MANFPKGQKKGTEVMVQVYNTATKDSAWLPGVFIKYAGATDRPYRVHVTCSRFPDGVDAAPECVRLKNQK